MVAEGLRDVVDLSHSALDSQGAKLYRVKAVQAAGVGCQAASRQAWSWPRGLF